MLLNQWDMQLCNMMILGFPLSCFWRVSFTFLEIELHAAFLYSWITESYQATSFSIILTEQKRNVSPSVHLGFLYWHFWPLGSSSPSCSKNRKGKEELLGWGHRVWDKIHVSCAGSNLFTIIHVFALKSLHIL